MTSPFDDRMGSLFDRPFGESPFRDRPFGESLFKDGPFGRRPFGGDSVFGGRDSFFGRDPFDMGPLMADDIFDGTRARTSGPSSTRPHPPSTRGSSARGFDPYSSSGTGPAPPRSRPSTDGRSGPPAYEYVGTEEPDGEIIDGYSQRSRRR